MKLALLALGAAVGIWLVYQNGVEGSFETRINCPSSKALFCVPR